MPRQLSQQERRKVGFNVPFARAVECFRRDALSRPDYDPATMVVFGSLMSRGLLEMLQAVEREFGEKGQEVATRALVEVGRKAGEEALRGVQLPPDMSPVERASVFITYLNEVFYASVEEPVIESEDACSFHIQWCPLQDIYSPLDCRIQRYLVEGELQAASALMGDFQVAFDHGKPSGHPTCHFSIRRRQPGEESAWEDYTRSINRKGLEKSRAQR